MPTASYAAPLNIDFFETNHLPHVWPDAEGEVRGISFSPLCKHVPKGARSDAELYALLALVDAIRGGRARERNMAIEQIKQKLSTK